MACFYAESAIRPHLDTRQLALIPKRADGTFHVESVEPSLSIRLTHVEFGAVLYVRCEAGSALCQLVTQMTRLWNETRVIKHYNIVILDIFFRSISLQYEIDSLTSQYINTGVCPVHAKHCLYTDSDLVRDTKKELI